MSILKSQIADGYDAFVYYPKANLLPFRAYIESVGGAPLQSIFRFDINWTDEGTAGYATVVQGEDDAVMYDMSGRRIEGYNASGFVIINRKKVYLEQ